MCTLVAGVLLPGVVAVSWAQATDQSDVLDGGVVLTKLSPPVYPRLARQARIVGDVDLMVGVRSDGGIDSVVVVSGHPMLKQAGLDSAQQSQFECRGCGDRVTSYPLKYKFQITSRDPPKNCLKGTEDPPLPAEVDSTRHQVTVFAWVVWICDPAVELHPVRSAKCLYLWRCGVHEKAMN
jgi:Gram-negative bacterial TonB protein C-terminal